MISSLCFCLGVIVVNAVYMVPNEGKEQEKRYVKEITYPGKPINIMKPSQFSLKTLLEPPAK